MRFIRMQGRAGPQTIAKSEKERDQDSHHGESLFVGRNINGLNKNGIFGSDKCDACGHQRIAYNSCLMESARFWGVRG